VAIVTNMENPVPVLKRNQNAIAPDAMRAVGVAALIAYRKRNKRRPAGAIHARKGLENNPYTPTNEW
jgi:hypothetical protein